MPKNIFYDTAIVGGGVSGTALLYTLATYTNIQNIILLEAENTLGSLNSSAKSNSQTLHTGDIETNYSAEKMRAVARASRMIPRYTSTLPPEEKQTIIKTVTKMVLGVGKTEVQLLQKRHTELHKLFPDLHLLSAQELAKKEPSIMKGRDKNQPVLALSTDQGHMVDFGALAVSFVKNAQKNKNNKSIDVETGAKVIRIEKTEAGYTLHTKNSTVHARTVVCNTDAHTLLLAKRLGYGKEFSLIPIAGTFYFTEKILKSKVYTVQDPKLLFAAVHGDPDLTENHKTRWGPTVRFLPCLSKKNFTSILEYLQSAGLERYATWRSFWRIFITPHLFVFFCKNLLYEIPYIGRVLFARTAQKICPSLRAKDFSRAKGYGGMRLQRVNTQTKELEVGEQKIIGENIIFNMTPSPGASACLGNAEIDTKHVCKMLQGAYAFNETLFQNDLAPKS